MQHGNVIVRGVLVRCARCEDRRFVLKLDTARQEAAKMKQFGRRRCSQIAKAKTNNNANDENTKYVNDENSPRRVVNIAALVSSAIPGYSVFCIDKLCQVLSYKNISFGFETILLFSWSFHCIYEEYPNILPTHPSTPNAKNQDAYT
jgi:hypothetical protein